MLGVVLWSDSSDKKAVIWCEDHGNLAYYNGKTHAVRDIFDFGAGDLVQFDLTEERHLRLVRNPRRISENMYPTLAQDLQALSQKAAPPAPRDEERGMPSASDAFLSAEIVPFRKRSKRYALTA